MEFQDAKRNRLYSIKPGEKEKFWSWRCWWWYAMTLRNRRKQQLHHRIIYCIWSFSAQCSVWGILICELYRRVELPRTVPKCILAYLSYTSYWSLYIYQNFRIHCYTRIPYAGWIYAQLHQWWIGESLSFALWSTRSRWVLVTLSGTTMLSFLGWTLWDGALGET